MILSCAKHLTKNAWSSQVKQMKTKQAVLMKIKRKKIVVDETDTNLFLSEFFYWLDKTVKHHKIYLLTIFLM